MRPGSYRELIGCLDRRNSLSLGGCGAASCVGGGRRPRPIAVAGERRDRSGSCVGFCCRGGKRDGLRDLSAAARKQAPGVAGWSEESKSRVGVGNRLLPMARMLRACQRVRSAKQQHGCHKHQQSTTGLLISGTLLPKHVTCVKKNTVWSCEKPIHARKSPTTARHVPFT